MDKKKRVNRKGSREIAGHACRHKKRSSIPNRHSFEHETESTSASAKKLKTSHLEISIKAAHGYRLINFIPMFFAQSAFIKCKTCNGDISFSESSIRGFGFKLVIQCDKCEPRYINSCPLIQNAYEINRRIVFAMRLLGVGYDGI